MGRSGIVGREVVLTLEYVQVRQTVFVVNMSLRFMLCSWNQAVGCLRGGGLEAVCCCSVCDAAVFMFSPALSYPRGLDRKGSGGGKGVRPDSHLYQNEEG